MPHIIEDTAPMEEESTRHGLEFTRIESLLKDHYWLVARETALAQIEQNLQQKYLLVHWQTAAVASTLLGAIVLGCVLTSAYAMSLTIVDWAGHKAVVNEMESLRQQAEGSLKLIQNVEKRTSQSGLSPALESQLAVPVGSVVAFPADEKQAPPHWLLCDGSLINQEDFPLLYGILGVRYGGEGTSKFGLPDYQSCSLEGVDRWGPASFEAEKGEIRRQLGSMRVQKETRIPPFPFGNGSKTTPAATVPRDAASPRVEPDSPEEAQQDPFSPKVIKVLWLIRAK